MAIYEFASLRGNSFVIEGNDAEGAWKNLCLREKENGSLWKTSDIYCNIAHVNKLGFSFLDENKKMPAYKRIDNY